MPIATGQFTIIDYNDMPTLTAYISSNKQKTQMFNPDTGGYNPDWSTGTFLELNPSIFKPGSNDLITDAGETANITAVTWTWNNNGVETAIPADATHVYSGAKNQILTIKANELAGLPGRDYICTITYKDPTTQLSVSIKANITFSRVVNGSGIADAIAWAPSGNIFKNAQIASLTAQCDLWRGSTIDTSAVTYRWFKQDAKVFTPTTLTAAAALNATSAVLASVTGIQVGESVIIGTANAVTVATVTVGTKTITWTGGLSAAQANGAAVKHANYDADAGAGWKKLSDSANNITGTGTNTVTIYPAWITNYANLMCIIKDTDSGSNTYNNLFKDTISIVDESDPYQAIITSTGGDVFKNGSGSSTLKCLLYQGTAEVDTAGDKTYTWYIFDKDGNATTFNGGAATKTGKSITVDGNDVNVKSTFQCVVS